MPVRFDDSLEWSGALTNATVNAKGPLLPGDNVKEICAWVYQKNGVNDAAATEMTLTDAARATLTEEGKDPFDGSIPERWSLELKQISNASLRNAPAFAVAIALILDASGNEKVVWWGQPLELKPPAPATP